jgi:hypothetical protein
MKKDPAWLEMLKESVFSSETQLWLFRSEHPAFAREPLYERKSPFGVMYDWWIRNVPIPGMQSTSHNGWLRKQLGMKAKVPKEQLHLRLAVSKVYFVQEAPAGDIKIGTSKDVGARVREMTVANPRPLVVLATMSGDRKIETLLHKRFASARIRIRGEWFRPVPELLAYIAEIKAA